MTLTRDAAHPELHILPSELYSELFIMIMAPSVHHTSPAQRILSPVCGKPALSAGGSSLQLRGGDFFKYS